MNNQVTPVTIYNQLLKKGTKGIVHIKYGNMIICSFTNKPRRQTTTTISKRLHTLESMYHTNNFTIVS